MTTKPSKRSKAEETVSADAGSVMPCPPTKDETAGLKSFFGRYWLFVLCGVVFLAMTLNNEVFKRLGALTYLPLLTYAVFVLAFIIRYTLNKTTTDAYIHTDSYQTDFASLPAIHKVWLTQIQFMVYIIVIAILASKVMGDEPQIRPEWNPRLDAIISGIMRDKDRYQTIQNMRGSGMPWYIVGGIHERESSRNFTRHLHEGSPLIHRTYYVPKGRLPQKNPPYTFEESAEDALYILKREDQVHWCDKEAALDAIEAYNGLGYRKYHPDVKSPYLWSGTTLYSRGKYVADGRFSPTSIDQQAGVVALVLRMQQRGLL